MTFLRSRPKCRQEAGRKMDENKTRSFKDLQKLKFRRSENTTSGISAGNRH